MGSVDFLTEYSQILSTINEIRYSLPSNTHVSIGTVRVMIVGLFDGLGGLRIAFRKLDKYVVVMCYISSEVDKIAKRVVRKHWPGVLEWGSVEAINEDIVSKLSHVLSTQIDHASKT